MNVTMLGSDYRYGYGAPRSLNQYVGDQYEGPLLPGQTRESFSNQQAIADGSLKPDQKAVTDPAWKAIGSWISSEGRQWFETIKKPSVPTVQPQLPLDSGNGTQKANVTPWIVGAAALIGGVVLLTSMK